MIDARRLCLIRPICEEVTIVDFYTLVDNKWRLTYYKLLGKLPKPWYLQ